MKIYTVTTLHLEYEPHRDETLLVRTRCVGFYPGIEDAVNCILENWGDIYENGHYNHAVIEEVKPGIYAYPRLEWWYKWDKNEESPGYYLIPKKPKSLENSVGFGIG